MADNFTTFLCRLSLNLGISASWNPQGLSRPLMGLFYLYFLHIPVRGCFDHRAIVRPEGLYQWKIPMTSSGIEPATFRLVALWLQSVLHTSKVHIPFYTYIFAEEIKSRLRSGNACYHSVQNILSSRLLSKNLKIKIYRTVILPVVLGVKLGCWHWGRKGSWGCLRTWCWGEYLEDEVTGEWRRLHNDELNYLYTSPNIVRVIKSRRMRWAGHVACIGEERGVYRVLVGKPEGRRPLGRPRLRWVDNIRTDLQ